METRVLLKHRGGRKAEHTEEFALRGLREITIGRDPSCSVKFDPENEDLVSRRHVSIVVDQTEPPEFSLTDLGSRNGTFVNKQRISGTVKLHLGDVVQLGPGGPELVFDMDPRPSGTVKATRLASDAGPVTAAPPMARPPARPVVPQPAPSTSKGLPTALKPVFLILGVAMLAGGAYTLLKSFGVIGTMSPAEIARTNTPSVVFFEVGWKLFENESGRQLNHVYLPNKTTAEDGTETELAQGGPAYLPVFVAMDNGLEPMLTTDTGDGKYPAIGGVHSGSGFVVNENGFILTNRHVAAAWNTSYHWPQDAPVGLLVVFDSDMNIKQRALIPASSFPAEWVPANAHFVIQGGFSPDAIRIVQKPIVGKYIDGRNDFLDVTFAGERVRNSGKVVKISDQIDLAMVKLDILDKKRPAQLYDNYDQIKPGDSVTVLGYPGVSPQSVAVTTSKDVFNQGQEAKVVPDPTISVGNIARVHRSKEGKEANIISTFGDSYELTINSTGAGNSGGPVFDDHGRVIAIFTAGRSAGGASATFAVPIRYGLELMGGSPAAQ